MAIDKNKFAAAANNLKIYEDNAETTLAKKQISGKKLTKKDTHKAYAFWANKEQIEVWKCYQEASGELEKAEDLGVKAITEYIQNHPLQAEEAEIYRLKLKAKGLDSSIYK